ncbi:hypothetical protein IFM89_039812, partial [Coptis chinensis]
LNMKLRLEDGTLVSKSEGVEFTVGDGGSFVPYFRVNASCLSLFDFSTETALFRLCNRTVTKVTNDKKVIKKIAKEGEGYGVQMKEEWLKWNGMRCSVHNNVISFVRPMNFIGKLQDGTVFRRRGMDDDELFEFKTDEVFTFCEQVVDGLDKAVMTMKKGEVVELTIAPEYGFGSSESKQESIVPQFNIIEYYTMKLSLNPLSRPVNLLNMTPTGEEEKKQSKVTKVRRNRTMRLASRKKKGLQTVEKLCTKVLELESTNVKALYRRAQTYIRWLIWTFFEIDIKKASEIDPNNGT